jgi:Rrf2 family protein
MSMLSRSAKFAIIALVHLGRRRDSRPILTGDISRQEHLPARLLEKVLLRMRHAGILKSRPGKGGGYWLVRPPETIKLSQIIRLFDGGFAPLACLSQATSGPCPECVNENTCVIRWALKPVHDHTEEILQQTTLAQLVDQSRRQAALPADYDIQI